MTVYAFLNQKGGVGKTTLAVHTATALARSGRTVLLIDADPQGSALGWASFRESKEFEVVAFAKPSLHKQIDELSKGYDDVVIDGPPRVTELARSIILASDLVVIPVQPSPMDVWAAAETVDLVEEASEFRAGIGCCLLVNRKIANTAIGRDVRKALGQLGVPVLESDIGQRVAFAETAATGTTVLEHRFTKGAREINRFVKELRRIA